MRSAAAQGAGHDLAGVVLPAVVRAHVYGNAPDGRRVLHDGCHAGVNVGIGEVGEAALFIRFTGGGEIQCHVNAGAAARNCFFLVARPIPCSGIALR